jgi:hypothetical protein
MFRGLRVRRSRLEWAIFDLRSDIEGLSIATHQQRRHEDNNGPRKTENEGVSKGNPETRSRRRLIPR